MASRATGKPFITANQVTFLRLFLMPLPCWLLYQGMHYGLIALITGTILGCTDFVDGYLARKYGTTVLGGLMDPIADKVFTAIAFIPAMDLGWSPAWLVALLFVREFLVTATRTSYERRGLQLRSSYLARYKTWLQMCGIGVLYMLSAFSQRTLLIVLGIGAVLPLVLFVALYLARRQIWRSAIIFSASFAVLATIRYYFSASVTQIVLVYVVVGVTWLSGFGYLFSLGKLKGHGEVTFGEIIRLVTSVVFPCLVVGLESLKYAPVWAVIALICVELAHGGLDNLLAHHRTEANGRIWGLRMGGECALYVLAIVAGPGVIATTASILALALGVAGLTLVAIQNRRFYLPTRSENPMGAGSVVA